MRNERSGLKPSAADDELLLASTGLDGDFLTLVLFALFRRRGGVGDWLSLVPALPLELFSEPASPLDIVPQTN